MSRFCLANQMPRALVDPIDSPADALTLIELTIKQPRQCETIAILLDHERRGLSIFTVTGTTEADAMFDILDILVDTANSGTDRLGGVILASIRPAGRVEPEDVDRWLEASEMLELGGLELVEWYVIGDDVACPRDLLGERPRWGSM